LKDDCRYKPSRFCEISFKSVHRVSFVKIPSAYTLFLRERKFKGEVDNKSLSLGASRMQGRWVGKNLDLALLGERIEDFFEAKGFKITKERSASEYKVSAKTQQSVGMLGPVIVRILGGSNDFSIEFLTSERSRSVVKFGFITSMFGGGSFIRRGLKCQEAEEKLEKDFWIYIEETIAHLVNSNN
jgi:hypothetical protein